MARYTRFMYHNKRNLTKLKPLEYNYRIITELRFVETLYCRQRLNDDTEHLYWHLKRSLRCWVLDDFSGALAGHYNWYMLLKYIWFALSMYTSLVVVLCVCRWFTKTWLVKRNDDIIYFSSLNSDGICDKGLSLDRFLQTFRWDRKMPFKFDSIYIDCHNVN